MWRMNWREVILTLIVCVCAGVYVYVAFMMMSGAS
jgi:hypothetical protein